MKKVFSHLFSAAVIIMAFFSMTFIVHAECAHELQFNYSYEPTCTEDGMKEDYYECIKCHELFADSDAKQSIKREDLVIPSYDHYFEPEHAIKVLKKATLKTDGQIGYPCVECGIIAETRTVPKVTKIQLSFTSQTYNKKTQKPTIKVFTKDGVIGSYEEYGEDEGQYCVTYPKSSVKVGRYTVKITFTNFYSGTVNKTYDIKPKGTKIIKISPKRKEMTVKWNKQADQTDGYQILYSTSSKFKNAKKVTVSGKNLTSKKIKGLKSKKKYYVKIRTYKKVKNGKKTTYIYSDWSNIKTVKVK
ncbi:MAG: fibronectin type III domain-containing protein [Lachnospiraceae bacterium]